MKKHWIVATWLLAICIGMPLTAQNSWKGAERTHAVKLGTTKPVDEVEPGNPTDRYKLRLLSASKPDYVRNFIGRKQQPIVKAGTLPDGPDPLVGIQTRDGGIIIEPIVNIPGMDRDLAGTSPPDVNGDASDQYYFQAVNSTFLQVHDLAGNKIGTPFEANTIWSQIGFNSVSDPIILFDQQAGRWVLAEIGSSSRILFAVSESGDPRGAWTAFAFSTPNFPDYPKFGIWQNAYVMTTNEGFGTIKFYTINREQVLAGEDLIDIQRFTIPRFDDPSWQTAQPVDWNGDMGVAEGTFPMIMRIYDDSYDVNPVDQVEIYEVDVNWNNEDSSEVTQIEIPVSPFDSEFCSIQGFGFDCVPQPNGQGLDAIPYIFMNTVHYRNFGTHSSIVGNFTVDLTGNNLAGIRWVELRKVDDGPWELYQEGTVGKDDGLNRFMGGIAMDSKGNIGLAYNVSGDDKFPSLRYTGRRASDAPGKMTVLEYEFATGSGSQNFDRFGDYASMSVDAQDMFWYTGETINDGSEWETTIVGFRLTRDSIDLGPRELQAPKDGPDLSTETVTACIINSGLVGLTDFQIGMMSEDGTTYIEDVSIDSLFTDSLYCHTFSETIDFSDFGPHELMIFTIVPKDSNALNDTCIFTVTHQTRWDASVATVTGVNQVLCDTFTELAFVLENAGVNELVSADIIWSLNGGMNDTIQWSGSLQFGETEDIPVSISDMLPGNNTILVFTLNPNGLDDQNSANDTLSFDLFSTPGGQQTTLMLETDDYPNETTWVVLDSSDNIILQGGPYTDQTTMYMEQWCLDTSQCYTFVLLDAAGDGIEFDGVEGNFQIVNGEGIVVASLNNPSFGFSDTTRFCLQSNCALIANTIIKHETAPGMQNGTINVFVSGGIAPLQFSVNGGMTFQSGAFFNNLTPGLYTVVVRDGLGCIFTKEVTILSCDIQVMAEMTSATGPDNADGAITVLTEGNNGVLQYSLNGGAFQSSPVFAELLPDTFQITVKDSVGCTVSVEVIVDYTSSVSNSYQGNIVRVFPNPSTGYFQFEVEGLPNVTEVAFDVLSNDGKVVKSGIVSNYSGILKGYFSVKAQPAGEYYLRFRHPQLLRLIAVIKQ